MRNSRGIALPIVLMAILVTSALIAGVFYSTGLELRATGNYLLQQQAFVGAEEGVYGAVSGWTQARDSIPVGSTIVEEATQGQVTTKVYLTRLDSSLFWIVGEGKIQSVGPLGATGGVVVHRRVGLSLQVVSDSAGIRATPLPHRAWVDLY